MWKLLRWFSICWWLYLFEPASSYYNDTSLWRAVHCRLRGHPRGQVYFNPGGFEPDEHCKDCGDLI